MAFRDDLVRNGMWPAVADTIDVGRMFWVDGLICTYTNLATAGKVAVHTPPTGSTQRFKIRGAVVVGGGTSFNAASGDRAISISDGTNTFVTLANAVVESAPANSIHLGDTNFTSLTSLFNTASVAGAQIYLAYSGGTTDHTTAGSLTFCVCLERVA